MFVTAADFANVPYKLPGITAVGASTAFAGFVANAEDEWLRKLVGNLFYDALIAGTNALPATWTSTTVYAINDLSVYGSKVWKALVAGTLPAPSEGMNWTANPNPSVDRWLVLRDGENYQVASIPSCPTFRWVGLEKMETPLIFSLWLKASTRSNTGQGVVVSESENSELVNPGVEIAQAWNKYYKITVGNSLSGYYGRVQRCFSLINTFYGYLVAKAADFDDVITDGSYDSFLSYIQNQYQSPGRMNIFDI